MTESVVVHTSAKSSDAGSDLSSQIRTAFGGQCPHAVVVFAAPGNDPAALLKSLDEGCCPAAVIGCTSAGEFATGALGTGLASAVAFRSSDIRFSVGVGRGLSEGADQAAASLLSTFQGEDHVEVRHRAALILTDALAGFADELIDALNTRTGGTYQFFGGGAGDNAEFRRTQVFAGTDVLDDAAVGLELLSTKPIGLGVRHGWEVAGSPLRVTQADGLRLISLNGAPAIEAVEAHALATGQNFDANSPLPFFLHNVIGIRTDDGYKLRVPLAVTSDGSIQCAAEIPQGAVVSFMRASAESAAEAASAATRAAMEQLNGERPGVAIFFDCVATRLRMGNGFALELAALQNALGDTQFVGCNTHGQIARSDAQFSGFHNCTAVVCVIPE